VARVSNESALVLAKTTVVSFCDDTWFDQILFCIFEINPFNEDFQSIVQKIKNKIISILEIHEKFLKLLMSNHLLLSFSFSFFILFSIFYFIFFIFFILKDIIGTNSCHRQK
jgi:hypothetical protein